MIMNKLSEAILKKIRNEKIMPIPRWHFMALHVLLFVALVISIALGAMAFGFIFRSFGDVDWEIVGRAGRGHVRGFLLLLPYIWFAFLGIVLLLAGELFSKTKTGYRYKLILTVLLSVVISLILGAIFYFAGGAHSIENELANRIRPYAGWMEKREKVFVAPDEGALIGMVVDIKKDEQLMIVDFNHMEWTVDISKAVYKNDFQPEIGRPVGVIGEKIEEGIFRADRIMSWRPRGPLPIFNGIMPAPSDSPVPPMPPFPIPEESDFAH
jgi:hypothetical protein